MARSDTFARPAFGKVALSFAFGIVVGLGSALPVIQDDLATVSVGDAGPVGTVLLIGVLSVAVVTTGLFAMYRLFWLVDR